MVYNLLSCLVSPHQTKNNQQFGGKGRDATNESNRDVFVDVYVEDEGITFVEKGLGGTSQASVNIQSFVFQTYKTNLSPAGPSEFRISLTAILQTLPLLSHAAMDTTGLTMSYDLNDGVFKIGEDDRIRPPANCQPTASQLPANYFNPSN